MFFGEEIERDPNLDQLKCSIFDQLRNIANELKPKEPEIDVNFIKFVSFEDALRELLETKG